MSFRRHPLLVVYLIMLALAVYAVWADTASRMDLRHQIHQSCVASQRTWDQSNATVLQITAPSALSASVDVHTQVGVQLAAQLATTNARKAAERTALIALDGSRPVC